LKKFIQGTLNDLKELEDESKSNMDEEYFIDSYTEIMAASKDLIEIYDEIGIIT
jgi:hypothetical protein